MKKEHLVNVFDISLLIQSFSKYAKSINRMTERKVVAFTMAELLISLSIIGVIAAITLPTLTGNINEKTWDAQRKALHARLSQAVPLIGNLNDYGTYEGEWNSDTQTVNVTLDNATNAFVTDGLSRVLKLKNVCDNDHFKNCGISPTFTNIYGVTMNFPKTLGEMNPELISNPDNPRKHVNTKAMAIETQNGESLAVFYSHQCATDRYHHAWYYSQAKVCVNFIYDLNGLKGPNTIGKDMGFMTALYPINTVVVAPRPAERYLKNPTNTSNHPANFDSYADAAVACEQYEKEESRLPNIDELISMYINRQLLMDPNTDYNFWSSTPVPRSRTDAADKSYVWAAQFTRKSSDASIIPGKVVRVETTPGHSAAVYCVRK